MRINVFLASQGIASRRAIDHLIKDGKIEVNGITLTRLGYKVQSTDRITVGGKEVLRSSLKSIVILLNKPAKTITTTHDTCGRPTVMNLVKCDMRVFPIGRLDKDTTGVLLLTNDGILAHHLMHPSREIKKTYRAHINRALSLSDQDSLRCGVMLDGRRTAPCVVHVNKERRIITISLHEGRNRQIHRMFRVLGYRVDKLDRICYAGLSVGSLKRGEWRMLTEDEIRKLTV